MIILEGIDVCPIAWYTIMDVSRATYYRWKVISNNGKRADHYGNVGTTKPQIHIFQAMVTLCLMLEQSTDHMPHKTKTLETEKKVVSKCLPSSWRWKNTLLDLNTINA
jgi:hypothetical protein